MNYIKPDDVVIFGASGMKVEVTAQELIWKGAGDALHRFAKDHQRRHPGVSYREALEVAKGLNPELVRQYAQYERR